jgi:hypothetical protein
MKTIISWTALLLISVVVTWGEDQDAAEKDASENASPSPYRGRLITLRDFGAHELGFLSLPDTPPKFGVLLLPDGYGMNDAFKKRCDWVAEQGAIALGLDLFNGHTAKDAREAAQLQTNLRGESAMKAIHAALNLLSESPRLRADDIFLVSLDAQCSLTLPVLREKGEDFKGARHIIGVTWLKPNSRCTIDWELLESNQTPFQAVLPSPDIQSKLEKLREERDWDEDQFEMVTGISPEAGWSRALAFWQRAAEARADEEN